MKDIDQSLDMRGGGSVRPCGLPPSEGLADLNYLRMYEERNRLVHEGRLDLTSGERTQILSRAEVVPRAGLDWLAEHPDSGIDDLDREIATA